MAGEAKDTGDFGRRGGGIIEHGLGAGHLGHDQELAVEALHLMMQAEPHVPLGSPRRPRNHHQRRFFRVRRGHGVDHVEGARPIGDGGHPEGAAIAPGGIGGKPDARLMAQGMERQDIGLLDGAEERQGEIAGDAEDFTGAIVFERRQQGVCEFQALSPREVKAGGPVGSETALWAAGAWLASSPHWSPTTDPRSG